MELDGSHLGSQGFSGTDLYESVLMHFKDAICLSKIFFKMGLFTVCVSFSDHWSVISSVHPSTDEGNILQNAPLKSGFLNAVVIGRL
jgi:hypothetical protein